MKQVPTIFDLKGEAHALRNSARSAGKSLPHQVALNLVAKNYGFDKWESLASASGQQPRIGENPCFTSLHRGTVTALWATDVVVPCYWDGMHAQYGKPYPLFELQVVQDLVRRFPEKLSLRVRDHVVLEQHEKDSFDFKSGFSPTYVMPIRTQLQSRELILYGLLRQHWSDIQAIGKDATVLAQVARDYVEKYPSAAVLHPDLFPNASGTTTEHQPV